MLAISITTDKVTSVPHVCHRKHISVVILIAELFQESNSIVNMK